MKVFGAVLAAVLLFLATALCGELIDFNSSLAEQCSTAGCAFDDPSIWIPQQVPTAADTIVVSNDDANFNAIILVEQSNVTVANFSMEGHITFRIINYGGFLSTFGTLYHNARIQVRDFSVFEVQNDFMLFDSASLQLSGNSTAFLSGEADDTEFFLEEDATVFITPGSTLRSNVATVTLDGAISAEPDSTVIIMGNSVITNIYNAYQTVNLEFRNLTVQANVFFGPASPQSDGSLYRISIPDLYIAPDATVIMYNAFEILGINVAKGGKLTVSNVLSGSISSYDFGNDPWDGEGVLEILSSTVHMHNTLWDDGSDLPNFDGELIVGGSSALYTGGYTFGSISFTDSTGTPDLLLDVSGVVLSAPLLIHGRIHSHAHQGDHPELSIRGALALDGCITSDGGWIEVKADVTCGTGSFDANFGNENGFITPTWITVSSAPNETIGIYAYVNLNESTLAVENGTLHIEHGLTNDGQLLVSPTNSIHISGDYIQTVTGYINATDLDENIPLLTVANRAYIDGHVYYSLESDPEDDKRFLVLESVNITGTFEGDALRNEHSHTTVTTLLFDYETDHRVYLKHEHKKTGLEWWAWLLIALAILALVVVIIVAVIMFRRRRNLYQTIDH